MPPGAGRRQALHRANENYYENYYPRQRPDLRCRLGKGKSGRDDGGLAREPACRELGALVHGLNDVALAERLDLRLLICRTAVLFTFGSLHFDLGIQHAFLSFLARERLRLRDQISGQSTGSSSGTCRTRLCRTPRLVRPTG